MYSKEVILKELFDAVVDGDKNRATEAAKQSLAVDLHPLTSINEGLTPGIRHVGDLFGQGELFLPEMILSANAMDAAISILKPHFDSKATKEKGKIVIGTIQGDVHDLGKNIVISLLKVNGFNVVDLGRDVPATTFVDKAIELDAQIIGISSLLTTCMPMIRDVIQILVDDGVRDKYKVIIGGGPISQGFADQIDADGYGASAVEAVELCNRFLEPKLSKEI